MYVVLDGMTTTVLEALATKEGEISDLETRMMKAGLRPRSADEAQIRRVRTYLTTLRLRIGFKRIGYADLHLGYEDVDLSAVGSPPATLLADPETQAIYHEVDVGDDGRFEHRLLLWPRGELVVAFDGLRLAQQGVEHRAVP